MLFYSYVAITVILALLTVREIVKAKSLPLAVNLSIVAIPLILRGLLIK